MQFSTSAEEGLPRVKCASLRRAVELLFDPNYDGKTKAFSTFLLSLLLTDVFPGFLDEEFVRVMVMMMHHFISPLGFAGELFTCYHAMVTCSPPKLWQQRVRRPKLLLLLLAPCFFSFSSSSCPLLLLLDACFSFF